MAVSGVSRERALGMVANHDPVAALYVETGGCYFGLPGVDPWDLERDAREYAGPHPVVAHPPCQRWGKYWAGSPTVISRTGKRLIKGDDAGCFASALASVRKFGGVLEHPADSYAWKHFGLNLPPRTGAWVVADWQGGWTCCVEQGAYGHAARKATWLYAAHVDFPSLKWGLAAGDFLRLENGYHSAEERARQHGLAKHHGIIELLSHAERARTPVIFRDLLISIARTARLHEEQAA
jgi:hypothetical protein